MLFHIDPLRLWVHKVLPVVYDDSLSYYEVLAKVTKKLNEVIDLTEEQNQYIEEFSTNLTNAINNWEDGMEREWSSYKSGLNNEWGTFQRNTEQYIENWKNMAESDIEDAIAAGINQFVSYFSGLTQTAVDAAEEAMRAAQDAVDAVMPTLESEFDERYAWKTAVGSPLVATTAAGMTDTTKVYVYAGSETGYVNGDWYYYDGTTWQDGGVYNSAAVVTDPTLSQSGVPADAKAAGDEIADLKSAIANKSTSWAADGECINAVGNADTASGSCRSDYIPVIAGQTIKLSGLKLNGVRSVCSYDASKAFVARVAGNSDITEYTYVVPTGVAYVRATGVSGVPVSVEYYGIYPIVQKNTDDITSLKTANTAINAVIGNNSFTFTSQDGYFITPVGNLDSSANSCATDFIPVTAGTTIKMSGLKLTSARSVCAYNDNRIFVSRIAGGTDDTEVTYLVPDGVAYIRATGSSGTPPTVIIINIANYFTEHHSDNAVRYVSATNGNDTYDGLTPNTAKATISNAISSGGLTIKIEPATYSETVTLTADHMKIVPSDIGLYDSQVADTPKIIINNLIAEHLTDIYIEDVECVNSTGYLFRFLDCRDVICVDCSAHGSTTGAGFSLGTTFGKFIRCYAYSCGDSSHQIDGFNIQGYGFTEFVDCVAHDNSDDGISHHNGCTGFINGGEYYNNGKGGVASPAHGAYVDVTGVYSHNNKYGLYAANANVRTVKINVNNSVFKNNATYDLQITDAVAVGWNNIYDTKDVTPGATFTEY